MYIKEDDLPSTVSINYHLYSMTGAQILPSKSNWIDNFSNLYRNRGIPQRPQRTSFGSESSLWNQWKSAFLQRASEEAPTLRQAMWHFRYRFPALSVEFFTERGSYRLSGWMYLAKNSANKVTVPQLPRVRQSGSLLNVGPTRRVITPHSSPRKPLAEGGWQYCHPPSKQEYDQPQAPHP